MCRYDFNVHDGLISCHSKVIRRGDKCKALDTVNGGICRLLVLRLEVQVTYRSSHFRRLTVPWIVQNDRCKALGTRLKW